MQLPGPARAVKAQMALPIRAQPAVGPCLYSNPTPQFAGLPLASRPFHTTLLPVSTMNSRSGMLLILGLALGLVANAAESPPGLAIGQKAPAFTLRNADGKDVALETLLKRGPVALVFYRSADW